MLKLQVATAFKKDLKKSKKQGRDIPLLEEIIDNLQKELPLQKKFKDHNLIGNWKGYRECHLEPDWLLIYKVESGKVKLLRLARLGSHSELFSK